MAARTVQLLVGRVAVPRAVVEGAEGVLPLRLAEPGGGAEQQERGAQQQRRRHQPGARRREAALLTRGRVVSIE